MFGHNEEQHNQAANPAPDDTLSNGGNTTTALPPADHNMSTGNDASTTAPAVPAVSDDTSSDYIMTDPPASQSSPATTVEPSNADNDTPTTTPAAAEDGSGDDLLAIKQQALQQLSPLVGHLDQSPEEQFRTTMMLIQAADNDKLIPQAYKAAQAITDEKVRAQALLDVVNEINYFTQQREQQ